MARTTFLVPLAVLALARLATAAQFNYLSTALPANSVWTDGVAIADIDNDGDNDILFANGSVYGGTGTAGAQAQVLYLNNGSGVFSDASAMLGVGTFNAKQVIAKDFDGDGYLDVLYASGSTGSPPRYLRNLGKIAGVWQGCVDETATRIPALALRSFCVCAGDVDNDGDLDFAVNDGGTQSGIAAQSRLLLNDGTGHFTDVTATNMPADLWNCQDITLFDFDADYDIDIALSGKAGGRLYLNDGTGHFTVNTVMAAMGNSGLTYECDYGDLDGDGLIDAAVQSISGFAEGWARNVGTGSPMVNTTFSGANGDDDNEMGCLDYDNDGDLDVLVGSLAGTEKAYKNNAGVFTRDTTAIQAVSDSTLDFGVGDLNGDHKYDLVTAQGESGNFTDKVYFNNGPADTIAPHFLRKEIPGSIGASGTVFRAQIQDAIFDDGCINATMKYYWATAGTGAGIGHGDAFHQGEGQFRALVPTNAGTTGVSLWWVATDSSGNTSFTGPVTVGVAPPSAWADIGSGLAGTGGVPTLAGTGTLEGGAPASLDLSGAANSAVAILFVSFSSTPVPFKGGSLAAFPFSLSLPFVTSPSGAISISFQWPTGIGSGFNMFVQYAVADAGGPAGAALSNCVQGTTP